MSDKFLHGVEVIEVNDGPRTIKNSKSSVIGIVGTAPEADPDEFPINTPVLIAGSLVKAAKLGKTGSLPDALDAILKQIGALVVVIRVDEGEARENTITNVIGEVEANGSYTGLHALLTVQSELGITPRILLSPGFSDANVVTAFLPIAERLRGIVIADTPITSERDVIEFAKQVAHPRVYAIYPQVINYNNKTVPASPYVAGVIARTDNDEGFWYSPSNKVINGIVGLSKPVDFALGDSSSKANFLNENNIATIINHDGFKLWGNRSTSKEAYYGFLCVRRTADIINDAILRAHLWAVDKNIVKNYLVDVAESVNAYLSDLKAQGAILSGKCFANKELNTGSSISQGKVYFDFEFTPAYPAEQVTFRAYLNNDNIEEVLTENLAQGA